MELEEFLELLRKYKEQPKIWDVNSRREMEFANAYKAIQKMVLDEEPNAKVECKIDDGNGIIVIEAEWMTIRNVESFCMHLSKANNFEIYPRLNETLCMNIMFNDVYKRVY